MLQDVTKRLPIYNRLLYGMSDAISYGCSLGMNMVLFPDKVFTLMSFLETCFGVGYSIGVCVCVCVFGCAVVGILFLNL